MAYLDGVAMPIHSFQHYLDSYRFMSPLCYSLQVYMCPYDHYGCGWLSLFQFYSLEKYQPGSIPAAAGLIHLGNEGRDGDNTPCLIIWSAAVSAGLDTVHSNWMALYFRRLTVNQIYTGGGGAYV